MGLGVEQRQSGIRMSALTTAQSALSPYYLHFLSGFSPSVTQFLKNLPFSVEVKVGQCLVFLLNLKLNNSKTFRREDSTPPPACSFLL